MTQQVYEIQLNITDMIKYSHKYTTDTIKNYIFTNKSVLNIPDFIGDNILTTLLKHNSIENIENLEEYVSILIEAGINVNYTNRYDKTALILASSNHNYYNIVKKLINSGANINKQNEQKKTALMYAVTIPNNIQIIKLLIALGASLNLQSDVGKTALMYAINNPDNIEIIKLLIDSGCDLNAQSICGRTALMFACEYTISKKSNFQTVELLLSAGANQTLKNNLGETVLVIVCQYLCKYYHLIEESDLILLTSLQYHSFNLKYPLMFMIRDLCDHISKDINRIPKYEKLIEILLNINTSTNEDILIYIFRNTNSEYLKNICAMMLKLPLELNFIFDGKAVCEWLCEKCDSETVKYCFAKNNCNEDNLVKCIKLGLHKEILMDLLKKLYPNKIIDFNLSL